MKKNNSSDLLKDAALRLDESRPKTSRFVMLDKHAGDLAELMDKKLSLRVMCKALEEVGIKISPPWLRLYLMTNFSEKYENNYSSRYRRRVDESKPNSEEGGVEEDYVEIKKKEGVGQSKKPIPEASNPSKKKPNSDFLVDRFLNEKMKSKEKLESKNDRKK